MPALRGKARACRAVIERGPMLRDPHARSSQSASLRPANRAQLSCPAAVLAQHDARQCHMTVSRLARRAARGRPHTHISLSSEASCRILRSLEAFCRSTASSRPRISDSTSDTRVAAAAASARCPAAASPARVHQPSAGMLGRRPPLSPMQQAGCHECPSVFRSQRPAEAAPTSTHPRRPRPCAPPPAATPHPPSGPAGAPPAANGESQAALGEGEHRHVHGLAWRAWHPPHLTAEPVHPRRSVHSARLCRLGSLPGSRGLGPGRVPLITQPLLALLVQACGARGNRVLGPPVHVPHKPTGPAISCNAAPASSCPACLAAPSPRLTLDAVHLLLHVGHHAVLLDHRVLRRPKPRLGLAQPRLRLGGRRASRGRSRLGQRQQLPARAGWSTSRTADGKKGFRMRQRTRPGCACT
jgi:hypothetical protein